MKNIFFELKLCENEVEKDVFSSKYSNKAKMLVKELRLYISSLRWANTQMEIRIVQYLNNGYTIEELSKILEINSNSLRSTIARLSERVRTELFGSPSVALDEVLCQEDNRLDEIYGNIKLLMIKDNKLADSYFVETYTAMWDFILKAENNNTGNTEIFDDDMEIYSSEVIKALRFYVKFSRDNFFGELDAVRPEHLRFVLDNLNTNKELKKMCIGIKEIFAENLMKSSSCNVGEKVIAGVKDKVDSIFTMGDS